ncbi:GNAT family N-acetyltransferase [Plantibacter sp. RU18]|uniref:GNAT family N-acetyltransferase n=1 Tax=Plantibacter sp. RU18 TaxID=3158143 RepID=UPI003D36B655
MDDRTTDADATRSTGPTIRLEPYGPADLPTLERQNTPEMTRFLGGPESRAKLLDRHERYQRYWRTGEARMFRIVLDETIGAASGVGVGLIGFWSTTHGGEAVHETGWSVESGYQGHGIARAALQLVLEDARVNGSHRWLLAFPRTDNVGSNALCRSCGFELLGEEAFEYPKGNPIVSNAWRYDLGARG